MHFTIEFVKENYARFNKEIFGDRLPEVPIRLSDARTFVGKCAPRNSNIKRQGHHRDDDFYLTFSIAHDLTRAEAEDTIIHEMIHLFVNLHNLLDTSHHGPLFRALMTTINAQHKRHISISHKTLPKADPDTPTPQTHTPTTQTDTSTMPTGATGTPVKKCVVAIIRDKNGWGFKLIPCTYRSILKYYQAAVPFVDKIELYLTYIDEYLAYYPISAAPRIYRMDREKVLSHLHFPKQLDITDKGISVRND